MQNKYKEVIQSAWGRGFKSCLVFVVAPLVISIIVLTHIWANANI